MNTEKTYYFDSYLREIQIQIIDQEHDKKGIWIQPDKTIAYPGGGGQFADYVTIDNKKVLDLCQDNGKFYYLVPGKDINKTARMQIDWDWRYYHMQQHTGQHLLSAVMNKHKLTTVSVHLGKEYTLVEFNGSKPDHNLLNQIETECNKRIRQSLKVESLWITPEEIEKYPLRRPPKDLKKLRIIHIDNTDYVACGGTHVRNTAEIGYIKISGIEKIRGRFRIKAYIGIRAEDYFSEVHSLYNDLKELLNTDASAIVKRIEDLLDERNQLKRKIDKLLNQHMKTIAKELIKNNSLDNGLIFHEIQDAEKEHPENLAKILAQKLNKPAFILNADRFFFMVPENSSINPNDFLKNAKTGLGIKGGGPEGFVQGVLDRTKLKELLNQLKSI
jgi:alanyl-tRNA synthetase